VETATRTRESCSVPSSVTNANENRIVFTSNNTNKGSGSGIAKTYLNSVNLSTKL
jgi:hypothetical protein